MSNITKPAKLEDLLNLFTDIVNPEDMYTVYDYQKDLRKLVFQSIHWIFI